MNVFSRNGNFHTGWSKPPVEEGMSHYGVSTRRPWLKQKDKKTKPSKQKTFKITFSSHTHVHTRRLELWNKEVATSAALGLECVKKLPV